MRIGIDRRSILRSGAGLIGLPALVRIAAPSPASAATDPTTDLSLVFEDLFQTIDTTVWNAGPKATTAEPGFYGRSAFARLGGEEGFDPYAIVEDPDAEGGKALQISARYIGRTMSVPGYYGNENPEYQWISGNLQSAWRDGTIVRGWRRGYFEARMHMPEHPLAWSAFWLMNGRSILWPQTSVEVDIVEHKGFEPKLYGTYLHEWGEPGEQHHGIGVSTGVDVTRGYHRYGALIEGDECIPYFDGMPAIDIRTGRSVRWKITRSPEMDAQNDVFWPLLTLALRNDVPFPDPLREADRLTSVRFDYVRVYA